MERNQFESDEGEATENLDLRDQEAEVSNRVEDSEFTGENSFSEQAFSAIQNLFLDDFDDYPIDLTDASINGDFGSVGPPDHAGLHS